MNARGVLSLSLHKGGVKIVLVASTVFANFLVGFALETDKIAVWSPKSLAHESRLLSRLYLIRFDLVFRAVFKKGSRGEEVGVTVGI